MKSEPNQFKVKISVPSHDRRNASTSPADRRAMPQFKIPLTLNKVIEWIHKQPYDAELKADLIKVASGFPAGAYERFIKHINQYIADIKKNTK